MAQHPAICWRLCSPHRLQQPLVGISALPGSDPALTASLPLTPVQNVAASCPDGCRALPREIVPVTRLKPAASKGFHQASHTQQTRTQLSSQRSSALAPSPWSLQEQSFSVQPCQGSLQSCTSTTGTPTYFLLRFRINGTGER